jgi:hypothetical protein
VIHAELENSVIGSQACTDRFWLATKTMAPNVVRGKFGELPFFLQTLSCANV